MTTPTEQSTRSLENGADGECSTLLSPSHLAAARRPLQQASTLPPNAYTSARVYQREVERAFLREWLCVGRVDQVRSPGDYFTMDLLGDKLVVVRDEEGTIHVLSRVCRHRSAEVAQGTGNTRSFRCPYHCWTYRLDGRLVSAPFMDRAEGFDRTACRLPKLRSEVWQGFIFANFDRNAEPLGARLAPVAELLASYGLPEMVTTEPLVYDSPYNWKLLVENFMESYHHLGTHRDSLQGSYPAERSVLVHHGDSHAVLTLHGSDEVSSHELPMIPGLEGRQLTSIVACVVYPFHLFALSPDNLAWYQVLPDAVDHFTLRIYVGFPPSVLQRRDFESRVQECREFTKTIHQEDLEACESVWRGLKSSQAVPGRLSHLEIALWYLNQWWMDRMA